MHAGVHKKNQYLDWDWGLLQHESLHDKYVIMDLVILSEYYEFV